MNYSGKVVILALLVIAICFVSCERNNTVCTVDNEISYTPLELRDLISSTPVPESVNTSFQVEIGGKMIEVDKVVDYPLCNDTWNGTVYVGCDTQIAVAEVDKDDNPLFFEGCNLNIQPNTIVYVAAHNDAVFYKGCSCHTGSDPVQ